MYTGLPDCHACVIGCKDFLVISAVLSHKFCALDTHTHAVAFAPYSEGEAVGFFIIFHGEGVRIERLALAYSVLTEQIVANTESADRFKSAERYCCDIQFCGFIVFAGKPL